jgi:predicted negative regulator of RcsB-dependent stress response
LVDELLSEKEQIEAIRSWWKENGRYIISGVVIGVGLLLGWNYWNKQRTQDAMQASSLYESLMNEVADGNGEAARTLAANLHENYASTVYAGQARLAMAKLYMDLGRDQDAANELSQLVTEGEDSEAQMLARLRLAKVLLYQDKAQEAADLLQGYAYRETAFVARYSETLGDAYVALERNDAAREAYAAALADNPNAPTVNRALVQMKINDLPRQAPGAATDTPAEAEADSVPAGDSPPPPTEEETEE